MYVRAAQRLQNPGPSIPAQQALNGVGHYGTWITTPNVRLPPPAGVMWSSNTSQAVYAPAASLVKK